MTETVEIFGQTFDLHPSGAVYWQDLKMLMIADVHFGKIAHFRKNGSAIPPLAAGENLLQLERVIDDFETETVCFLGDLFHSSYNNSWLSFEAWVKNCSSRIILVSGNHDIIDPYKYNAIGIEVLPSLTIGPFLLTHHPTESEDQFNFSGHIHPAVRLQGKGRQQLKLACFFMSHNQLILPAFGTFTGKHTLRPKETDSIFAIVDGEVMKLKT